MNVRTKFYYSVCVNCIFQIGESEALAERCQKSCEVQNIPFYRFNPQLGEKIDPGMTNNLKLLHMIITTRIYTHTQEAKLEKLLDLLTE